MHLTGPLRAEVTRIAGHERALVAALQQLSGRAEGSAAPAPHELRPLPYLLYLADGDAGDPSAYNVFSANKLSNVQRVRAEGRRPGGA